MCTACWTVVITAHQIAQTIAISVAVSITWHNSQAASHFPTDLLATLMTGREQCSGLKQHVGTTHEELSAIVYSPIKSIVSHFTHQVAVLLRSHRRHRGSSSSCHRPMSPPARSFLCVHYRLSCMLYILPSSLQEHSECHLRYHTRCWSIDNICWHPPHHTQAIHSGTKRRMRKRQYNLY